MYTSDRVEKYIGEMERLFRQQLNFEDPAETFPRIEVELHENMYS